MNAAELESRITMAALMLSVSKSMAARRKAWAEMVALHRKRTPDDVARLERQRGLR